MKRFAPGGPSDGRLLGTRGLGLTAVGGGGEKAPKGAGGALGGGGGDVGKLNDCPGGGG